MKTLLKSLLVSACLTVSAMSHANLIKNGSFEDNNVSQNSWRWFQAVNVNGWEGSNIEIWDRFKNFAAYDGFQLAELNAHGQNGNPFSIQQTFSTQIGSIYDVSFAYSARANDREAFAVDVFSGNSSLFSQVVDDHTVKTWSVFNTSFEATSNETTLAFSTITPHMGTVGNFIDNVIVIKNEQLTTSNANAVSSPSAVMLLGLSLVGLTLLRRK